MRNWMVAGILAAGLFGLGGAASAQQAADPQDSGEEYCIYEKLTEEYDYEIVAEAYLAGDSQDADMLAVLDKAADACAGQFGMTEEQKSIATEIAIYGSTADYLSDELSFAGVSDDAIDGVFSVMDEMSDEDADLIYDNEKWRDDAAMTGRLRTALVAKGVPNKDDLIMMAFEMIELSAFTVDATIEYMIIALDFEDKS